MEVNWKLWVAIGVLAVLAGGGAAGYYFLQTVPRKEAEVAYEEGRKALEAGDLKAAEVQLELAVKKNPGHEKAGFLYFDTIHYVFPERAEALLAEMEKRPVSREGLISRKIRLALDKQELGKAQTLVKVLETLKPWELDGEYAELLVLLAEGKAEEGMERFGGLMARYPQSRDLKYLMARFDGMSEGMLEKVRSKRTLLELVKTQDALSLRALFFLSLQNDLPLFPEDWTMVGESLRKHPFLEAGLGNLPSDAVRGMVRRMLNLDRELALSLAKEVAKRPDATGSDRLAQIEIAQALSKTGELKAEIERLRREEEPAIEERLVLAKQEFLDKNVEAGLAQMEALLRRDPKNVAALQVLVALANQEPVELSPGEQGRVLDWILQHPSAGLGPKVNAYGKKIQLEPARRAAWLERAEQEYGTTEPVLLARWLVQMGEAERALGVLPEERALREVAGFAARYEALMQLKRYPELAAWVERGQGLVNPLQREVLLTQATLGLENKEKAAGHWDAALQLAREGKDARVLSSLASLAREMGDKSRQRVAYGEAYARQAVFDVEAGVDYLGLILEAGDLAKAREFAGYVRNQAPDNPILVNNDCYLQILNEQNLAVCVEDMEKIVARFPEVSQFRGTLALGQLLAGFPEAAQKTLEKTEVDSRPEGVQSQWIFALVQAANGQRMLAQSLAQNLDKSRLNRQEVELLERFMRPENAGRP